MPKRLKLIFAGTPDFAVPALRALHQAGHKIIAVYTRPPRKAGRGQVVRLSAVHQAADALGLQVHTPDNLRTPESEAQFQQARADIAVVVAYGQIVPQQLLAIPRYGCWNIHASLLPRWRGAAPIQRAIMAGDSATGISIMQMDAGLDTGAVLAVHKTPISADDTAHTLHDRLALLGAQAIIDALHKHLVLGAPLSPRPQDELGTPNYAPKIGKHETRIDWQQRAPILDCFVRGLSPTPGAWFEVANKRDKLRIKVLRAIPIADNHNAAPGTVLDMQPTIACGTGALRLIEVQRAGKAALAAEDFMRGMALQVGVLQVGQKLD